MEALMNMLTTDHHPEIPITKKQLAAHYGYSPRTIQRWTASGKIPAIDVGSKKQILLFYLSEVDAALHKLKALPVPGKRNGAARKKRSQQSKHWRRMSRVRGRRG